MSNHLCFALREERALRGFGDEGLRAWLAMALPLLEGSLERVYSGRSSMPPGA